MTLLAKRWAGDLAVSPDGRQLLFTTEKLGIAGLCELPHRENIRDLALLGITLVVPPAVKRRHIERFYVSPRPALSQRRVKGGSESKGEVAEWPKAAVC